MALRLQLVEQIQEPLARFAFAVLTRTAPRSRQARRGSVSCCSTSDSGAGGSARMTRGGRQTPLLVAALVAGELLVAVNAQLHSLVHEQLRRR
jgi:hypothetical protein